MKEELEWDASWRFRAFAFWGDKYFFYPVIDEIHIYIYMSLGLYVLLWVIPVTTVHDFSSQKIGVCMVSK